MANTSVNGIQFDPNSNLPDNLRRAVNGMMANMSDCQFVQYGIYNNYFLSKFDCEKFLIKPQKKLHLLSGMDDRDFDDDYGDQRVGHPKFEPDHLAVGAEAARNESAHTQDSNARQIQRTASYRVPDFSIEAYFGEAPYRKKISKRGAAPDVLRAVIEVGDGREQDTDAKTVALLDKVENQLGGYMNRCQGAWKGRLWGIAIVRYRVLVIKWKQVDPKRPDYTSTLWDGEGGEKWKHITDAKFLNVLDEIVEWENIHHEEDGKTSTALKQVINPTFDLPAKLCAPLQKRWDSMRKYCPNQFAMYGPVNGWLYCRFPPSRFLIKPQRRLINVRGIGRATVTESEAETETETETEDNAEYNSNEQGDEEHDSGAAELNLFPLDDGEEALENKDSEAEAPMVSISAGPRAGSGDSDDNEESPEEERLEVLYPDFTVEKYAAGGDEIVLIIEIATYRDSRTATNPTVKAAMASRLSKERKAVQRQLLHYLTVASIGREQVATEPIHGIAFQGPDYRHAVATAVPDPIDGTMMVSYEWPYHAWSSIFTQKFSKLIDRISK
ncbi:hypothetical protein NMY22_g14265 [Coprinellus aureogranulatus]|nr:hypothetical protein NMY22_g14265 [Coprinellus aureogranulatus]